MERTRAGCVEPIDTQFLRRLKNREDAAWFELWEVFGPALERMVERFGRRRFTPETVRDISQETLMRVAKEVHRFDPDRGARFSTWLFQIAKHVVAKEFEYRMAKKRGSGVKPDSIDASPYEPGDDAPAPPAEYEMAVFRAKVYRAMRLAEERSGFLEFECYKARILRGMLGKDIAVAMGISEPTVSRYLAAVRETLRATISDVVRDYSFTGEEIDEVRGARLDRPGDDFDRALAEIYAREEASRKGYDTLSRVAGLGRGAFG